MTWSVFGSTWSNVTEPAFIDGSVGRAKENAGDKAIKAARIQIICFCQIFLELIRFNFDKWVKLNLILQSIPKK